jgi:hypothetical protein
VPGTAPASVGAASCFLIVSGALNVSSALNVSCALSSSMGTACSSTGFSPPYEGPSQPAKAQRHERPQQRIAAANP